MGGMTTGCLCMTVRLSVWMDDLPDCPWMDIRVVTARPPQHDSVPSHAEHQKLDRRHTGEQHHRRPYPSPHIIVCDILASYAPSPQSPAQHHTPTLHLTHGRRKRPNTSICVRSLSTNTHPCLRSSTSCSHHHHHHIINKPHYRRRQGETPTCPSFECRYLTNPDDVYSFNAWDHVGPSTRVGR